MLPLPSRSDLRRGLPRLLLGLVLFGWGLALMVVAGLGLSPWDVLHQGISRHTGIPIGTVGILTGFAVLGGWIPLRERWGLGTVLNVVVIGVVLDLSLLLLPERLAGRPAQVAALLVGVLLVGVGSGLYIGAGLGPGPRDGLMTGLARRGFGVGPVRFALETSVLAAGWLLGGTVGVGTLLFAFGIGPLVGFFLPRLTPARVPSRSG